MRILAIDLGKHKSVACDYRTTTGEHRFTKLPTRPQALHDLIVQREPDRVVIEVGNQAGWIKDLCDTLEVPIQVANPNHDAWRWKRVKRKTDRDDALKLAQLSAVGQLPLVSVPSRGVRQWRSLIHYRGKLVNRRTAIRNSIRALLDREGLTLPAGKRGWSKAMLQQLQEMSRPIDQVDMDQLWRGQLAVELTALQQIQALLDQVEAKLNRIASADERVRRLRTIPGVGARLAETVVAMIDDPHRFKSRREVAAYAGLVPRQFESGTLNRHGRITGAGPKQLRALLVEIAWLSRRYNPHFAAVFEQTRRGSRTRGKIAAVATARRLLITCWAMLRDQTDWQAPNTPPPTPQTGPTPATTRTGATA